MTYRSVLAPRPTQHDVRRFEVAVDDSLVVRFLQANADVADAAANLGHRERSRQILQRFTLQVLEHKERPLIDRRGMLVNRDEVRRAESREQLGFAEKLVDGEAAFRLPDLDRDEPLHVRVRREKHLGLRSARQAPLDSISVVQRFADHFTHRLSEANDSRLR